MVGTRSLSPRAALALASVFNLIGVMAGKMVFEAAMGHARGIRFSAAGHLKRHPEFAWESPFLRDLVPYPCTSFSGTAF